MYTCIMTKFKIFASFFRYSLRIIEGILINLATNGIMYYMTDFFTSYQFYTMIVVFLFSIVVVWWLERIGVNEAIFHAITKKYIKIEPVTQPAKPQQKDHNLIQNQTRSALRDVKKFQKLVKKRKNR